jgi:hypothetical protein
MSRSSLWAAALAAAVLSVAGCTTTAALGEASSDAARVEPIEGTDLSRITLTAEAYTHLGVKTEPVREASVGGRRLTAIPIAALLYDPDGKTWVFTSTSKSVFVRAAVSIDHIDGDLAYLGQGPRAGSNVVTVGVPELYGAELGVEGE